MYCRPKSERWWSQKNTRHNMMCKLKNASGRDSQQVAYLIISLTVYDKKLSYRRETARQLPTWRGLSPPVHSPSPSGYTYAYRRIRNPQQTYMYVKRAVRKAHFKLNRAFKVIQGYPYLCRPEPRAVYRVRLKKNDPTPKM